MYLFSTYLSCFMKFLVSFLVCLNLFSKGRSRKENLEELVSAASGFNPIGEDADDDRNELEIFLDQASLDAGENQADLDEDAIQLMTLHCGKQQQVMLLAIQFIIAQIYTL